MTFFMEALKKNHDDTTGLNNMIVFSFLLHALILSIIFFSPSMPSPRWTFGPSYMVDLVSLPSTAVDVRSSGEIPREVLSMDRRGHSTVMKKKPEQTWEFPSGKRKRIKKKRHA